jgi:hypothetical protein
MTRASAKPLICAMPARARRKCGRTGRLAEDCILDTDAGREFATLQLRNVGGVAALRAESY